MTKHDIRDPVTCAEMLQLLQSRLYRAEATDTPPEVKLALKACIREFKLAKSMWEAKR